jgi:hypothetical protein
VNNGTTAANIKFSTLNELADLFGKIPQPTNGVDRIEYQPEPEEDEPTKEQQLIEEIKEPLEFS